MRLHRLISRLCFVTSIAMIPVLAPGDPNADHPKPGTVAKPGGAVTRQQECRMIYSEAFLGFEKLVIRRFGTLLTNLEQTEFEKGRSSGTSSRWKSAIAQKTQDEIHNGAGSSICS